MNEVKKKRDFICNKSIEQLEYHWWNDNAETIAKVWEMHDDISWTVRKYYIRRAREFLLGSKKNVTILELGCGSGWVGQLLAGPKLNILGTDFSESQIKLAKENATRKGLGAYCTYQVSMADEWPGEFDDVDGVLIHCFLHHLSGKELENLILTLKRYLGKGKKIWIYEPAFSIYPSSKEGRLRKPMQVLLTVTSLLGLFLGKMYARFNWMDQSSAQAFLQLAKQAEDNGWYLSPKEVPFDIEEFSAQLNDLFIIKNSYWATINLVGAVQQTNMLKNPYIRMCVNKIFLPLFSLTDIKLCREIDYLRNHLVAPLYGFHVWECIVG